MNAIFYVSRGDVAWRLIPMDPPSRQTAFGYFSRWRDTGLFGRINHHLVMADREQVGWEASPSAAVLDNGASEMTMGLLAAAGIDGLVEQVISVYEVKLSKPRAQVYLYAVQAAGAAPGEVALIATHPWFAWCLSRRPPDKLR